MKFQFIKNRNIHDFVISSRFVITILSIFDKISMLYALNQNECYVLPYILIFKRFTALYNTDST